MISNQQTKNVNNKEETESEGDLLLHPWENIRKKEPDQMPFPHSGLNQNK